MPDVYPYEYINKYSDQNLLGYQERYPFQLLVPNRKHLGRNVLTEYLVPATAECKHADSVLISMAAKTLCSLMYYRAHCQSQIQIALLRLTLPLQRFNCYHTEQHSLLIDIGFLQQGLLQGVLSRFTDTQYTLFFEFLHAMKLGISSLIWCFADQLQIKTLPAVYLWRVSHAGHAHKIKCFNQLD